MDFQNDSCLPRYSLTPFTLCFLPSKERNSISEIFRMLSVSLHYLWWLQRYLRFKWESFVPKSLFDNGSNSYIWWQVWLWWLPMPACRKTVLFFSAFVVLACLFSKIYNQLQILDLQTKKLNVTAIGWIKSRSGRTLFKTVKNIMMSFWNEFTCFEYLCATQVKMMKLTKC